MFTDPTIADGRDYLNDILGKVWSPATLLSEIVVLLPEFLKKVYKEVHNFINLQKLGTYHLGHTYNLEDFLVLEGVAVFPGQEMLAKPSKDNSRYLVITRMSILNFEPINKNKNIVKLISWANIQSLMSIKRKREEETALVLNWKDKSKKEGITQIFLIDDAPKCVELIVDTMKKIGITANKSTPKEADLRLEDVTVTHYADMDINQILENIAILESRLQSELTITVINTLTTLYQKAIEFYSAFGNKNYEIYVNKLHSILSREDIQAVLRSTESNSSNADRNRRQVQEQNGKGAHRYPDDEDDEEEEKKSADHRNRGEVDFGGYPGSMGGYIKEPITTLNDKREEANENLFAIDDEEETPKDSYLTKSETKLQEPDNKAATSHQEDHSSEDNKQEDIEKSQNENSEESTQHTHTTEVEVESKKDIPAHHEHHETQPKHDVIESDPHKEVQEHQQESHHEPEQKHDADVQEHVDSKPVESDVKAEEVENKAEEKHQAEENKHNVEEVQQNEIVEEKQEEVHQKEGVQHEQHQQPEEHQPTEHSQEKKEDHAQEEHHAHKSEQEKHNEPVAESKQSESHHHQEEESNKSEPQAHVEENKQEEVQKDSGTDQTVETKAEETKVEAHEADKQEDVEAHKKHEPEEKKPESEEKQAEVQVESSENKPEESGDKAAESDKQADSQEQGEVEGDKNDLFEI
eukprot:CAMPEP_0176407626 /NCGR_PEP_ID=MMETSP0127-20121128/1511_1 /TAXON_ID=938130 /ORGANISM="Platyophrya macrostoma, Strain WH" /LENGTH=694 /DNA_ID=CAMNT_0017786843 /DNA_START=315 /DNA_END=2399 /DNA_ORIENTATION=-